MTNSLFHPQRKPAIVLVGGHQAGKTSVAEGLAKHFGCMLVSTQSLLKKAPFKEEVEAGGAIDRERIKKALITRATAEHALFRGYVLDDLSAVVESEKDFDQMINTLTYEDHHMFFVHLKQDLNKKYQTRRTQKLDPTDLKTLTEKKLLKLIQDASSTREPEESLPPMEEPDLNADEDEEDGEHQSTSNYVPIDPFDQKKDEEEPFDLAKLPMLVTRLEDLPSFIEKDEKEDRQLEELISAVRDKIQRKSAYVTWIEVDTSRPVASIISKVTISLEAYGYDSQVNAHQVVPLDLSGGLEVTSDDIDFNAAKLYKLQESEPTREPSPWMIYDPVSWHRTQRLMKGSPKYLAIYKNRIFYFESEENQYAFVLNPDRFLKSKPKTVGFSWLIYGNNEAATTVLSKRLAQHYGCKYLNAIEFLEERLCKTPKQDLDEIELIIKQELYDGKTLSLEAYGELLRLYLSKQDAASMAQGWVIDQLPLGISQIEKLSQHGFEIFKVVDFQATVPIFDITKEMKITEETVYSADAISRHAQNILANYQSRINQLSMDATRKSLIATVPLTENFEADFNRLTWAVDPLLAGPVQISPNEIPNHPFGEFKNFCPIRFMEHGCLHPGKPENAVKYQGHVYVFAGEPEQAKFMLGPENYLKKIELPAPKIAFMGVRYSGKTSQAARLCKKHNLEHLDWGEIWDPEDGKTVAEVFQSAIMNNKELQQKGFILEGFPQNKDDVTFLKETSFTFDVIAKFKIEQEELMRRVRKLASRDPSILTDTEETYAQQVFMAIAGLEEMAGTMREMNMIEVDANEPQRVLDYKMNASLKPYLEDRANLVYHVTEVLNALESLYRFGSHRLSQYRYECPVELRKKKLPTRETKGNVPMVIDNVIYVVKENNKQEFLQRTYEYVERPGLITPTKARIWLHSSDPQKASQIAKQIAQELDLIYIQPVSLIQSFLDKHVLDFNVKSLMQEGKSITQDILLEMIEYVAQSENAWRHGWIMDSCVFNPEWMQFMQDRDLSANYLIVVDSQEDQRRTSILSLQSAPAKDKSLEHALFKQWKRLENLASIKHSYADSHQSLFLPADFCMWKCKVTAIDVIRSYVCNQQEHIERKLQSKATAIKEIGLSTEKWLDNISQFKNYCSVAYVDDQKLVVCQQTRDLAVEYESYYYTFSSLEHKTKFLNNPKRYASAAFPTVLPSQINATEFKALFPMQLALKGFCPVTFREGELNFQSIVEGSMEYLAKYDNVVYAFAGSKELDMFMSTPWRYHELELPKKLPPRKLNLPVNQLPIRGYLEQSVADILSEALLKCGRMKPKFPFKSLSDSASTYLALYLKANNPKTTPLKRLHYEAQLKSFEKSCQELKTVTQTEQMAVTAKEFKHEHGDLRDLVDRLIQGKQHPGYIHF